MRIEEIRDQMEQSPFVPFRIHISNGSHFDILHPDFLLLSRTAAHIGVNVEDHLPERIVRVGLLDITHLEPLEDSLTPNQN